MVSWYMAIYLQVVGSSLSFLASSFISVTLSRSDDGFNSPYRRLIFAMSISDMLQSAALLTGPFAVPVPSPLGKWAVGNKYTCQINGFAYNMGSSTTPIYIFSLCLYTLLKIKRRRMTNAEFAKKVELPLHILIILFSLLTNIFGLAYGTINSTVLGAFCAHAAYPTGCRQRPDMYGECDASDKFSSLLIILSNITVPFASIFGIIICMVLVCHHFLSRDRIMFGGRTLTPNLSKSTAPPAANTFAIAENQQIRTREELSANHHPLVAIDRTQEGSPLRLNKLSEESLDSNSSDSLDSDSSADEEGCKIDSAANDIVQQEAEIKRREILGQIIVQAFWFMISFFCTYIFWVVIQAILIAGKMPPDPLFYIAGTTYPIGGVLNVLVFTRPEVLKLRQLFPGKYSYLRAYLEVLKGGGMVPGRLHLQSGTHLRDQKEVLPKINPTSTAFGANRVSDKAMNSSACEYDGSAYIDPGHEIEWSYVKGKSGNTEINQARRFASSLNQSPSAGNSNEKLCMDDGMNGTSLGIMFETSRFPNGNYRGGSLNSPTENMQLEGEGQRDTSIDPAKNSYTTIMDRFMPSKL